MHSIYIVVAALVVFIVVAGILKNAARMRAEVPSEMKPDYLARKTVLSPAERSFLGVLEQALPDGVGLLVKIRLGDVFLTRPGLTNSRRASAWNRINQKHVDFLLVRATDLAPFAGIELDDNSHDADDRKQRDAFVDQVFQSSGLPLLHVPAKTAYDLADLGRQIATLLR